MLDYAGQQQQNASAPPDPDGMVRISGGTVPFGIARLAAHRSIWAVVLPHSVNPASRNPFSTRSILLLKAAVPTMGPKLFSAVFGHSFM